MNVKQLPVILFLCLMASVVTLAQPDKPRPHRPNPEAREKVQVYVKEKVMPVLQQQRLKLEKQLSDLDKRKIEALRGRLANAQQQRETFRQEFKDLRGKGRPTLTEDQKNRMQQNREEFGKINVETRQLTQKYQVAINRLYAEIKPATETWKTDLRAIMASVASQMPAHPGPEHHPRLHPALREFFNPGTFLLWDVKKPLVLDAATETTENKVYPNPVLSTATFAYKVTKAGTVTIHLVDEAGKVLRQVSQENKPVGTHQIQTDLSSLKNGIYFYRVTTAAGTETIRFIKK